MVRTGISRGLAVAALAGMGAVGVGALAPAHAASGPLATALVSPSFSCPTAKMSNGYVFIPKGKKVARFYPKTLTGKHEPNGAAMVTVCIKNVTKVTQQIGGGSQCFPPFPVNAGQTLGIYVFNAGTTVVCDLVGSKSTVTIHAT